jgi:hypothetical protein
MGLLQSSPDTPLDEHASAPASFAPYAPAGETRFYLGSDPVQRPLILLPHRAFYGTLLTMGSKDKGRKEVKKAPKPKPKPEPGRRQETFTPTPAK